MSEPQQIINATRRWLDEVVIHHNFCPFARFVRDTERVRYQVCEGPPEEAIAALAAECDHLTNNPDTATTLLILTHSSLASFDSYLDLLDIATGLLAERGLEGVYQLASFHPHYQFEGTRQHDVENYTNRSPYPTFHLIREADIERVLADYPNPEKIYQDNIETTQSLGYAHFAQRLDALRDDEH